MEKSVGDKLHGLGNYKGYYTQRPDSSDRLNYLKTEWFRNKNCIDIGCNNGHLTFQIAEKFGPRSILGVDADAQLIRRAKNRLAHTPDAPSGSSSSRGLVPRVVRLKTEKKVQFPKNLEFQDYNLMLNSPESLSGRPYDTLVCCSVTKWIHLNHGDDGLLKFFHSLFNLLVPSGIAIIEYQPWKSYERNKNTSDVTKAMFKTLNMRPEQFEDILTNRVGFSISHRLGTPLEEAKGFSRPILVLIKPEAASVSFAAITTGAFNIGSHCDELLNEERSSTKRKVVTEGQPGQQASADANQDTADRGKNSKHGTFSNTAAITEKAEENEDGRSKKKRKKDKTIKY